MIQFGCRLWNITVASVLLLTFSNILLTVRLLHSSDCEGGGDGVGVRESSFLKEPPPHQPPPTPAPPQPTPPRMQQPPAPPQQLRDEDVPVTPPRCRQVDTNATPSSIASSSIFRADYRLGRWDSRRMYKFFDLVIVGERYADLSKEFTVCLATQSSVDRLGSLVQVAHHWSGPISLALFAASDDEYTLLQLYIAYLRRCFTAVRDRVSFHLAFPKDKYPHQETVDAAADAVLQPPQQPETECLRPEASLTELLRTRRPETVTYRQMTLYPQNHLRNLARRNCQTDYVFLTDVDIVPSARFAEGLDVFLRGARCDGLCAYVIPTYEIHDQVRFPRNKTDLVRLTKRGLARPFHQKVFIYNQFATNFTKWQESAGAESSAVHISHNVTNFEFLYEPFYVAPDTVPAHDERFIGYGFTRNSQVYEMYLAGYQFHVLSPIFTCQWGLQTKKQRPSWRERQNSVNHRLFEGFKREALARYGKEVPPPGPGQQRVPRFAAARSSLNDGVPANPAKVPRLMAAAGLERIAAMPPRAPHNG